MTAHTARTAGTERAEDARSTQADVPAGDLGGLPWIEDAGKVAPCDARELSRLFFGRLQVLEEGTAAHQYARNTLIEMNLSLVRFAAGRFRHRGGGGDMEDIVQVGTIGLIKAIDRFELSREVEFTSFAVPYITGEIKRFFRDTTWAVHVPRRLQELRVDIARTKESLVTELDRDPTVPELAEHMGLSEDEVTEGIVAANGYAAGSLDMPADPSEAGRRHAPGRTFADVLGGPDPALETVENLHTLAPLLGCLDARERRIIDMRFGQEMTQAKIGAELGISQMHVSRLISRILRKLRNGMLVEE
ncbi:MULTISPECIES: SigB/SigF/SigG family RNA polymerase sigma factor [unclassified Streptomyces]|uniref:SigB/SigF/SigG family RNA polymerase sigma factor n=1 Tax=unclassified Streptomyces TaxID=2593676 RepID=UPI000F5B9A39|nr:MULTISPECIES: SigB/SigF/SigG family RNA polymerase sigma factor [unclassified Streptomyces]WSG49001.1 SigB/SigF/SigG family RNA polymerase sigma factor [Streptomyces sp. NBC_01732]WSW99653.1 SigB/SigF/SigG family RNA polymerase sigma factor [Streptomyces sp. NBC_00987]MCX4398588.1 SigB/SigF/SigG family RNA polymerase sigma factor [Streptomyces sp. NBC_01767]MCX5098707.1 SigB/SigF/SigG family RNA polymerase sigma factor [Streptomyces sp. NBC_00439]MCX5158245.1 SigB/SigF/SigG family RNA polym